MDIDGFSLVRSDRTEDSLKESGGGICMYINNRWCKNISVKARYCDRNIELLVVSVRPFYLPREFSNIHVLVTYIPPDATYSEACSTLIEHIEPIENSQPDSVIIVLGDMNQCKERRHLSGFEQVVSCPTTTRNDNISATLM